MELSTLILFCLIGLWRSTSIVGQKRSNHITVYAASSAVQTNATAGFMEFLVSSSNRRTPADLTGFTRARIVAGGGVVGSTGTTTELWYSVDGGANFLTTNCKVLIDSSVGHVTSVLPGSWATIPTAARRDVLLAAGTVGGDAVADPAFAHIVIELQ